MNIIKSKRLILRQIFPKKEDLNEYIKKGTGYSDLNTSKKVRKHLNELKRKKDGYEFFIILKDTNQIIGSLELCHLTWFDKAGEIGYHIRKEYRNKGYSTEACRAIINFCFKNLKFRKIYADTDPDNFASQRVLEKLGFKLEGKIREKVFVKGKWIDEYDFGLLKSEWRGR
jgi:RimJ/RimL family protein N-acetyltransferase